MSAAAPRAGRRHEVPPRSAVPGAAGGRREMRPVRPVLGRGRRANADGPARATVLRARRPAERERRPVRGGSAVVRPLGERHVDAAVRRRAAVVPAVGGREPGRRDTGADGAARGRRARRPVRVRRVATVRRGVRPRR